MVNRPEIYRGHYQEKNKERKQLWRWPTRVSRMMECGGLAFATAEATILFYRGVIGREISLKVDDLPGIVEGVVLFALGSYFRRVINRRIDQTFQKDLSRFKKVVDRTKSAE